MKIWIWAVFAALVAMSPAAAQAPATGASESPAFSDSMIPAEERDRTLRILREFKLIERTDGLDVLNGVKPDCAPPLKPENVWCRLACDSAAAVAAAACNGVPACLMAVEAARRVCHSRC